MPCYDGLTCVATHIFEAPGTARRSNLGESIFHAALDRVFHDGRDTTTRHQHATVWLEDAARYTVETYLRVALLKGRPLHLLEWHTALLQCRDRLPKSRIVFARKP